ncbi:hypothetical protein LTR70_010542 [Exophiala xenobiotica]|uniref:Uncharacterized protein n=1 Tax=Lithohypha guttulata TaxID=1690604 RepID=A0ABR0JTQ8_9EURO|nr:hypothetical protein LTR24_010518 [Lithohypha guttulata]KAK5309179.1 hypothetical protein LTR70_010542 [Exophiala xenobiotica]
MSPLTQHDSTFDTSGHRQLDRPSVTPAGVSLCQHGSFVEVPGEHSPSVAVQPQHLNHAVVHRRSPYDPPSASWRWLAHHESCRWGKASGQAPLDWVERRHEHDMTDTLGSNATTKRRNGEELCYVSTLGHVHRLCPLGHGQDEYVRVRRRDGRKMKVIDGGQGVWDTIIDWTGGFMMSMLGTIPI